MNKLGFMITCFDEVNAINVATTSLRYFYPEAKIAIFCESDSGFDNIPSDLLVYDEDTQSDLLKLKESTYNKDDFPKVEKAMRVFLKRVKRTCDLFKCEYLCLHCPDTLIRGEINIPNGAGLLGSCVNNYFPNSVNEILIKNGGVRVNYFGAVPAIFNVEDFYKAYYKITETEGLITELASSFYAAFTHDIFMSILFSLIGKTEEYNPDIVECNRNPKWMSTNHPIVHQFRTFYPKRTAKYKSQEL